MSEALVPVRLGTLDDIDELVRMRALMFVSMGVESADHSWQLDAAVHYERMLSNGRLVAAVVEAPDAPGGHSQPRLASSGVVSFLDQIPNPNRPESYVAHISSMCTDVEYRRRGYGEAVLDLLLERIRRRGIDVVELHATPDGEALYRRRGFESRPGGLEMRATLTS